MVDIVPVIDSKNPMHAYVQKHGDGLLKKALLRQDPQTLQHSKLLKLFRVCDKCPLGEKKKMVKQGKQEIEIKIPASCSYFEKGRKDCPVGVSDYIAVVKEYYHVVDSPQFIEEAAKFLMKNAISDASMARDVEVLEKGRPGFTTDMHETRAVKVFEAIAKMKGAPEQHLHVHSLADEMVNRMFDVPTEKPAKTAENRVLDEFIIDSEKEEPKDKT